MFNQLKKIPLRGFVVLCGCMLLHMTLGNTLTNGNMIPYMTSYLHVSNPNVSSSDLIWITTLGTIGQGLFMNVGGILSSYVDPRLAIFTGSIIASSGVALSYFTIKQSVALVSFTYGFVYGVGMGLAYMAPVTVSMAWFPNNRALVTGLIVGSLAFGGCISSPLQTEYINPNNTGPNVHGYFTDPQSIDRVPYIFLLMGATFAAIQLIGYLLISFGNKRKTQETTTENVVQSTCSSAGEIENSTAETCQFFTPRQMLCHPQFYVLWTTIFFYVQISFINDMYKVYGETFINDDKYLALVGTIRSLCNASGRMLWGYLMDKFNYKSCMLCVTTGCALFAATLPLTPYGGRLMYGVWVWGITMCLAGSYALCPAVTAEKFGVKYAGINYGLMFSSKVIGTFVNAFIVQNLTHVIGLDGLFGLFAVCSAISFLITLLLFKM